MRENEDLGDHRDQCQPVECGQIAREFSSLIQETRGDLTVTVSHRSTPDRASGDSLVFVDNEKSCRSACANHKIRALLLHPRWLERFSDRSDSLTLLISKNVSLTMALVAKRFFWIDPRSSKFEGYAIHPSATIAASATLGEGVVIGPHATIYEDAIIGKNCFIGASTVIEEGVVIGDDCTIQPLCFLGRNTKIGNRCFLQSHVSIGTEGYGFAHDSQGKHYRIPQTGGVVIGDDVEIGAHSAVDSGTIEPTRIGDGTKIDNICHFAHNFEIGKHGLVTAGFVTAGSTRIGDHFACGGHSTVNGHITVTDHVQIAGRSAIHQSVTKPGAYGGHPLEPVKDYLRTLASLTHLTQMRKEFFKVFNIKNDNSEDES